MNGLSYYWPLRWSAAVGFHKPTVRAARRRSSSSHLASSRWLDQGGRVGMLIEGIWQEEEMMVEPFTPQSHSDVVGSLRLRLLGPDHPRPSAVLADTLGAAGRSPLRTRGCRWCLWHLLHPTLGEGGRLTPTTAGARLSSLNLLPRARKEGGCAAGLFCATSKSRDARNGRPGPSQSDGRWA